MTIKPITEKQRNQFNAVAMHPLQSYEWGEFREKTGIKVIRRGVFEGNKLVKGFQLTIHPIPHTLWNIGYLPKSYLPDEPLLEELYKIGKQEKCIFIQLEPNVEKSQITNHKPQETKTWSLGFGHWDFRPSAHPLFTKYTFQLDLTKSEDELLKNMHPKTRYNIKVAQKHDVQIVEDDSDEAFEIYWKLTEETTKRQNFYAHTKQYHTLMWKTLNKNQAVRSKNHGLKAHLFLANYKPTTNDQRPMTLVAWILFTFHDTLYYPYGASSNSYKNVMAANLMMWEAIKFGKKLKFKTFDMWGSMGPNPDEKDPWYGFHRFKQGYGPNLVEFVGSYDLIIHSLLYQVYKTADTFRSWYLKLER